MLDCPTDSSLPSIRVWSRNINFLSGIIKYKSPKIQFSLKPNRMFAFPCAGPFLTSSAVLNGTEREKLSVNPPKSLQPSLKTTMGKSSMSGKW